MKILDKHIDNAVHAAIKELKKSGHYFTGAQYCQLNEHISTFMREDCDVDVMPAADNPTHLNED
jgi:hypothetical protein|tara:strand:+ start:144 stop:335 length:192 start_codon:yes stop_codon:yes gene_type:complete